MCMSLCVSVYCSVVGGREVPHRPPPIIVSTTPRQLCIEAFESHHTHPPVISPLTRRRLCVSLCVSLSVVSLYAFNQSNDSLSVCLCDWLVVVGGLRGCLAPCP